MSVYWSKETQKWVAQVGGFPDSPKRRSVTNCETEHDAQIAENKLKEQCRQSKTRRQQDKTYEKINEYLTPENRFTLGYWIAYTVNNHWINPDCKQKKNVTIVAKRMGFDTDIRLINKQWQSDYAALARSSYNNKDQTIKCHLEALRTVLGQACDEKVITDIPKKPTLQGTQKIEFVPRPKWVDELQIEIVKQSCLSNDKRWALHMLVWFLRFVGCRVSEALQLDWADIQLSNTDFDGKPDPVIWFKHAPEEGKSNKPKRTYKIEVWSELELTLLELKRINPAKPFPYSYDFVRRRFNDARDLVVEKLGLDESIKEQWTIHRLRALSCTEKANEGWNCWDIKAWHNHSDVKVSQRYVTAFTEKQAQKRRNLMESQARS